MERDFLNTCSHCFMWGSKAEGISARPHSDSRFAAGSLALQQENTFK